MVVFYHEKMNKNIVLYIIETFASSSQTNLLLFDENPIKFVRVKCDIKSSGPNELSCFEDEILAVIEGDINKSEWLIVKNAFNSIGRVKRIHVEPIDDRQYDDERNDLLFVPDIKSTEDQKLNSNPPRDPLQALIDLEFSKLVKENTKTDSGEILVNIHFSSHIKRALQAIITSFIRVLLILFHFFLLFQSYSRHSPFY